MLLYHELRNSEKAHALLAAYLRSMLAHSTIDTTQTSITSATAGATQTSSTGATAGIIRSSAPSYQVYGSGTGNSTAIDIPAGTSLDGSGTGSGISTTSGGSGNVSGYVTPSHASMKRIVGPLLERARRKVAIIFEGPDYDFIHVLQDDEGRWYTSHYLFADDYTGYHDIHIF